MRKLKLQMQMSVDGFVAGPDGELDWMQWNWSDDIKKYVGDLTDSVDTILLGRKMTDGFVSHWSNVAKNTDDPEYAAAKKFVELPKIVFVGHLINQFGIIQRLQQETMFNSQISLKRNPVKILLFTAELVLFPHL